MPIYERRCLRCKRVTEHLMKVKDREKDVECPSCGHMLTKRIMSATPTTFKFADDTAIKAKVKRNKGFGVLKGREAKHWADKHDMTPNRNPKPGV